MWGLRERGSEPRCGCPPPPSHPVAATAALRPPKPSPTDGKTSIAALPCRCRPDPGGQNRLDTPCPCTGAPSEPNPTNATDPIPRSHRVPFPSFPAPTGLSGSLPPLTPQRGVHPHHEWPRQDTHGRGAKPHLRVCVSPPPRRDMGMTGWCGDSSPGLALPTRQGPGRLVPPPQPYPGISPPRESGGCA